MISSGGLLSAPSCVAVGPGGELYVAEFGDRWRGTGAILRVESVGGAQSVFAADTTLFHGPFDIAVSPDGFVWTAQFGHVGRRAGFFVRTRIADGASESIEGRAFGLTIDPEGRVFLSDCQVISQDCAPYSRYVYRYPGGAPHWVASGPLAVVPRDATPASTSTWGSLKVRYR